MTDILKSDYPLNIPNKSESALDIEKIFDTIRKISEDLGCRISIHYGDEMIDIEGIVNINDLAVHIQQIKELKEEWDRL